MGPFLISGGIFNKVEENEMKGSGIGGKVAQEVFEMFCSWIW